MKQQVAWAIVTTRGSLAVFDAQCPIYWQRQIAVEDQRLKDPQCRVVKVTMVPVVRQRGGSH